MGMRVGGVEMANIGGRTLCVLQNDVVEGGGIQRVGVMLDGMDIISENGVLPDGRIVPLVNAPESDEAAVKAIKTERDHWGRGMGDAFVGPVQNRVKATNISGKKGHIIFDGRDQVVPVDDHGVMLHSEGFGVSDLKYKLVAEPVWNRSNNYASITGTAVLHGWFSEIHITQIIELNNGVTTRLAWVQNVGKNSAPCSFTTHRYSKFPSETDQSRANVVMELGAYRVLRTKTEPFVPGETLLPEFSPNPFGSVTKTPFKGLFNSESKDRSLGDIYLDHCFVGLKPEKIAGETARSKYSARLRYPQAGYGVEVYVPFNNGGIIPVHALQVYTPPMPAAAYGTAAFEFAACLTDPFNPTWKRYPVADWPLFTSSGLRILHPYGHGKASEYRYSVVHRMINMGGSGRNRTVVAVDGFRGRNSAAPLEPEGIPVAQVPVYTRNKDASKMKGDVAERVKKVLIDVLSLDKHQIAGMGSRSRLIEDLGADSLDESELIMAFEEEFEIEVDDRVEFSTVGDVMGVVETALAEKAKKKGR